MRTRLGTRRFPHWLGRALTAAFVIGIVVLIAGWLAFQHKPRWYRPAMLDETGLQRARTEAINAADSVSDQMVEGRVFELTFDDRSVNAWLAALPHMWPEVEEALPPQISNPAVGFEEGELRLGAHYITDRWQAIVSLGLGVEVSDDRGVINIRLDGAYAGSLPVPEPVLERLLEQLLDALHAGSGGSDGTAEPFLSALREINSVDELLDGVTVKNRFVWFNGDRPFRIDAITIDRGKLNLRIEPL